MSPGPEFHETRMGLRFFEGTLPRIADALERIAEALEAQGAALGGPAASPPEKKGGARETSAEIVAQFERSEKSRD